MNNFTGNIDWAIGSNSFTYANTKGEPWALREWLFLDYIDDHNTEALYIDRAMSLFGSVLGSVVA